LDFLEFLKGFSAKKGVLNFPCRPLEGTWKIFKCGIKRFSGENLLGKKRRKVFKQEGFN